MNIAKVASWINAREFWLIVSVFLVLFCFYSGCYWQQALDDICTIDLNSRFLGLIEKFLVDQTFRKYLSLAWTLSKFYVLFHPFENSISLFIVTTLIDRQSLWKVAINSNSTNLSAVSFFLSRVSNFSHDMRLLPVYSHTFICIISHLDP